MRRLIRIVPLAMACLLPGALAAQQYVSVPFPAGVIGQVGKNTGKLNGASNFSTIGIMRGAFRQLSETGEFGGTQGNDLSGTLRLTLTDNSTVDIPGAINWRITTNGKVQYFGFIPALGYGTTLPGGYVLNDTSNYAIGKIGTPLTFADGQNVSGNAALSGLVDELNIYLAEVNGLAPLISGPTGQPGAGSSVLSLPEGTLPVFTYSADTPVTWSISGGADAARFTIDSATGALSFVTAPDYDAPVDAGANNVYDVIVTATDSQGRASQHSTAITVTELPDPVITATKTVAVVSQIGLPFDCLNGAPDPAAAIYAPGACVEYTITVSAADNGAPAASNVHMLDQIPTGVSLVGVRSAPGFSSVTATGNQVDGVITSLSPGGSATLVLRAMVE